MRYDTVKSSIENFAKRLPFRVASFGIAVVCLSCTLAVGTASATKQAVDYFGTEVGTGTLGGEFNSPQGVAVNNSGAGPAEKGDIYVVDSRNNRIQRFGRDDNGTPAETGDDTYPFISVWGAGVDSTPGGEDYQVCTVASQCQAGLSSGDNGALGYATPKDRGDRGASGIAVDQDTGEVYVTDAANLRVNVYTGDGAFLRSFGYDVVASGPGHVSAPNERQQLVVKASGGKFSLSFGDRSTGSSGLAFGDPGSLKITIYSMAEGSFAVGQGVSGLGIVPGTIITEVQSRSLKLSQPLTPQAGANNPIFGLDLPYNATAGEVEDSLNALPSIGGVGGSVTVTGGPGNETGSAPYTIDFGGTFAEEDVRQMVSVEGGMTIGAGSTSAITSTIVQGGAYEICEAASGDACQTGSTGSGLGEMSEGATFEQYPAGIAISAPDGSAATGTVFLADAGNRRINTYNLDGSSPGAIGSAVFDASAPQGIAVDSRGIVYASNGNASTAKVERYDSEDANGTGIGFLGPIAAPPLVKFGTPSALAVDFDLDGAGPKTDVLYVAPQYTDDGSHVQQYGPINDPGLTSPPTAIDDAHATTSKLFQYRGLGLDEADGRLYVTPSATLTGETKDGVYVLDDSSPPPTASLDSLGDITASSVTAHATINPNGPPATSYHFEYSTDGTNWKSSPSVVLGSQKTPQAVEATIDPPGGGLEPETLYHVRVVAKRKLIAPVVTSELTFTTLGAPPLVETTGSPVRTTTTARLDSRVDPRGAATNYYFEYGTGGPCDVNPCTVTAAQSAGAGKEVRLVSQQLTDLAPATTYHYRVIADNGKAGSPVIGEDMTLTTYASDEPLSHGRLPGPPGSDRAWEQVNQPDTGGNQIATALGYSQDGSRASFRIAGGTPDSSTGSLWAFFFSERSTSGWQVKEITPPRSEQIGADWETTTGSSDLSTILSANTDWTAGEAIVWRFDPAGQPSKLFELDPSKHEYRNVIGVSADGTRTVVLVKGGADPAYPQATAENLYDVSSGSPQLVNVLPGGAVSSCGVQAFPGAAYGVPVQQTRWVSENGSLVFFTSRDVNCNGESQLYMRAMEVGETREISSSPISGSACGTVFLKSTPGAAFFWTRSRLTATDTVPTSCSGGLDGDVYRYDLGDESLKCVTCVVAGLDANVYIGSDGADDVAVAENGSRVYFRTQTRLLPSAAKDGVFGAYRVNVAGGDLAYVAPEAQVGQKAANANALSADGSVLLFRSASAGLNAPGGQQNGGSPQYYRYDDSDRSLVCVSCPADGSAPTGSVAESAENGRVPVVTSADGNTVAFATPTSLVGADLNTAGAGEEPEVGVDAYEWRDGRTLLLSDGLGSWTKNGAPKISGISADGRDIFILAATQYTPDALDGYQRLYDARIGGGFEFPQPPKPCPLEVCQGIPKGAPNRPAPGTGSFSGPGNATKAPASCRKGKVRRKGRCVTKKKPARKHRNRANHNRRASR